jgi:ankyrin repeat protein
MTTTLTIEEVIDLIEQHSGDARKAVEQLTTYCQQDKSGRTPLNSAIQFNNQEITRLLTKTDDALNFFPKIDQDLLKPVRHMVSDVVAEKHIGETEKHLAEVFDPRMCLQRTPLHQACRYTNQEAIALLISKNVELDQQDILGVTPFELCIEFGEPGAADQFMAQCDKRKKNVAASDLTLRMLVPDPALYQQVIRRGKLDIKAKRFAFNLACALLDKQGMKDVLEQGLNINKTMCHEFSPILEVCTSRLLSTYQHPDAPRLAGQYAATKPSCTGAIHIDNENILNAETLEDIEALFSNASQDAENRKRQKIPCALSEEERQSQVSLRLTLVDYLVERGMDAGIAESKTPYGFLNDVLSTNSIELLQALVNNGFSLAPERGYEDAEVCTALSNRQYEMVDPLLQLGHQWGELQQTQPDLAREYLNWEKKNVTDKATLDLSKRESAPAGEPNAVKAIRESAWTWQLAGESVLLAATDPEQPTRKPVATVRLTHNNVYGPVNAVQLFVRIGKPGKPTAFEDLNTGGKWRPMTLVEELMSVDGEMVARSSVNEPVYGETPWEATYECKLAFKRGKHAIEIKVVSDIEGMTGVMADWIVKVA